MQIGSVVWEEQLHTHTHGIWSMRLTRVVRIRVTRYQTWKTESCWISTGLNACELKLAFGDTGYISSFV